MFFVDHGVLIVGYGKKEYPLFNKTLPYWTIKNSWGPVSCALLLIERH